MAQTEHPKLGSYLQSKLDERKMSANALSFAAGVAQSTISLLLRQGEDLDLPGTHPQVLSSVCNVLDLDYLYVFQLAEYIPFDYEPPVTVNAGNFIQREFGNLTRGQQKVVLEVLQLIQQTGDFDLDGEKIQVLLKEIRQLQKHHAMFRVRRFTRNDEAGRITGALLRILTPQFLMGFVHERLVDVFGDEEPDLSPEHIQMIVSHIYSQVILNILLPRKEISNPLEKLYWLILPSGHLEHEPLTPEQSASVRGLWNLLKKVVTEKDAK